MFAFCFAIAIADQQLLIGADKEDVSNIGDVTDDMIETAGRKYGKLLIPNYKDNNAIEKAAKAGVRSSVECMAVDTNDALSVVQALTVSVPTCVVVKWGIKSVLSTRNQVAADRTCGARVCSKSGIHMGGCDYPTNCKSNGKSGWENYVYHKCNNDYQFFPGSHNCRITSLMHFDSNARFPSTHRMR